MIKAIILLLALTSFANLLCIREILEKIDDIEGMLTMVLVTRKKAGEEGADDERL